MTLNDEFVFEPIPIGLSSDLSEHYDYATTFLASYSIVLDCVWRFNQAVFDSTLNSYDSAPNLSARPPEKTTTPLIEAWNKVQNLSAKLSEGHLFPPQFLTEVKEARESITKPFAVDELSHSTFLDPYSSSARTFKSAFTYLEFLAWQFSDFDATRDHPLLQLRHSNEFPSENQVFFCN